MSFLNLSLMKIRDTEFPHKSIKLNMFHSIYIPICALQYLKCFHMQINET